ncbi:DUF4870 domain-containing protein [Candidatus Woesearchaeota archaeon]|nr:DUF4870 domain-containing protein [Candidatus Woesearchaeota archaeon]
MAKKHVAASKPSSKEVDEGKVFAFLGVFLGIIGFIVVLLAKKDNKYAMYYAKQGLVLTIAWVIIWVIAIIPIIGWIIGFLGWILLLVLWIIGWVYALGGTEKPIPIIGQFADKFNI